MKQKITHPENRLGTDSIGKLIAQFAIPSVVAMLVSSLYNIIDQIFIGQGVGYLGNGATHVVFLITLITLSVSLLLGDGTAAYFSLRIGEGKQKLAAKGVGNAIVAMLALSVISLIVGSVYLEPILKAFGGTDTILPLAMDYGRIIVFGLPFIMTSTAFNAVIRADGSPKYAMFAMMSGALLNVILDPIFIFVLHWGVEGAAVATVIGQLVTFGLSAAYFRKLNCIQLTKNDFHFSFRLLRKTSSLGISSFIDQISFTFVMAVNNNLLAYFGAASAYGSNIPLTAFGVAMKVQQILFAVALGIGVGMQPIVGYNYGARNYARVRKACFIALSSATAASLLGAIILVIFPLTVIAWFGSANETLYIAFSERFFKTYFLFIGFLGFQTVAGIFFQAIGKPIKATIISLSYQFVFRILSALLLSSYIGLDGVLWSGPLADILTFLLAAGLIAVELKQMRRLSTQNN